MFKIIILILFLQSCMLRGAVLTDFKSQACLKVYCEDSENSNVKKAGLKLVEIAAGIYNLDLELDRGVCENYYLHREVANGYLYLNKSAYEVCKE